jgi:hypothetical protein
VPDISRDRNDLAGSHCLPPVGLEDLQRTIQDIKYLGIGVAMEWNYDSWGIVPRITLIWSLICSGVERN